MTPLWFDEGYLRSLRSGNPEVEQHFVAHFGTLLRIKLRSRLRSPQLVEDATQETFARVFRSLHSAEGIRHPERLGAFVCSVCDNVVLELFRAEKRHSPLACDELPEPRDGEPGAEESLVRRERLTLVRRIIEELPERDRSLLRALYLEEREKDAVCAELGVGRDYLRVLLHRAKLQFRARYLEREGERECRGRKGGAVETRHGASG